MKSSFKRKRVESQGREGIEKNCRDRLSGSGKEKEIEKEEEMAMVTGGTTQTMLREIPQGSDMFTQEWGKAHNTILNLLYQRSVSQREWQDVFFSIYNIHSWVEEGDVRIREALTADIDRHVNDAASRVNTENDDLSLLNAYICEWTRFHKQADILPCPFKPIESPPGTNSAGPFAVGRAREYADLNVAPPMSVRETLLSTWNAKIFNIVDDRLLDASMKLLEMERNGEIFDAQLIIGVRQSYVTLHESAHDKLEVYRNTFERAYIDETVSFYKIRAAQFLEANGIRNYMAYADRMLEEEERRAEKYLHPCEESVKRLLESCVRVLVGEFEAQLLEECTSLIRANDIEKIRMLYRLIKRTPTGIDTILKCIDEHIKSEGLSDMRANADTITTDPEKYVQQLLTMFDKFSSLIREGFYDDARLLTARDKAFREVINDPSVFKLELAQTKKGRVSVESKCPELLANFCDLLLRKTQMSKKLSSEEVDERLGNLLLVLKYVNNKDVFMRFHKAHLSRRLVLDMSADQEKEESLVTKLRECGMPAEHVNKLFRMLQDIELNKDLNQSFKRYLWETNSPIGDMLNIKVLNAGAWGRGGGVNENVRLTIPRQLEDYLPAVEEFYKKQHSGRKLQWVHHWSNGTIVFNSDNGRFDLDVTTFQLAVLFCWIDRPNESISFETLRLATELPDTELARTLYSLSAFPKMKYQILEWDGKGPTNPKEFSDSTMFKLNCGFHLVKNGKAQQRGRVNLIGRLQLNLDSSAGSEHEDIVALRILRVQEAIVKVLKMRKELSAWQLHNELVDQLKCMFVPTRQLIKEQIEWLIENKYVQRSTDDFNTFVYVA